MTRLQPHGDAVETIIEMSIDTARRNRAAMYLVIEQPINDFGEIDLRPARERIQENRLSAPGDRLPGFVRGELCFDLAAHFVSGKLCARSPNRRSRRRARVRDA
jgi:hypothetical protein